jgi:HEAT repeat protein
MLRAAAAPERFLDRGFSRFLSKSGSRAVANPRSHAKKLRSAAPELGVVLPADLARFMTALAGTSAIADFIPRPALPNLTSLVRAARRGGTSLARLVALLADAVPFGETSAGEVVAYFLADGDAKSIIAAIDPTRFSVRLVCQGAAELAVICSVIAAGEEPELPPFGIAVEERVRMLVQRGRLLANVLLANDSHVRTSIRGLAVKPLDLPPPEFPIEGARKKRPVRTTSLVLGGMFETFFRTADDVAERLAVHASSSDSLVREATALLLSSARDEKRPLLAKELARRRELTLKTIRAPRSNEPPQYDTLEMTRRIVTRFDDLPPNAESFGAIHEREETLLALTELGDRRVVPTLLARALTGDATAVDMLAALGDRTLVPHLLGLLQGAPSRTRLHEAAVVRTLVALRAKEALPALQMLLEENPMTNWREGLERVVLVRELVLALGELEDATSASQLFSILESTSQEYRTVIPVAAYSLGRIRHVPALATLERLLFSPKSAVSTEAIWAVGMIGQAHPDARETTAALLDRLTGLEPGAEVTRLTALAKVRFGKTAPKTSELRSAIERALWQPAFRQEETSRRRAWGLRALEELAAIATSEAQAKIEADVLFLGHESVRHFVTRDDHRVRKAAQSAFAAWGLPVPKVRSYFAFIVPEIERAGGIEALLEAVRDPLGIFRYNVATRLAEIGDVRSIRPLAEATARLFAEPPTSTYEYDDAPPQLVMFVRALAKLNRPQTNDVLIDGLRSDNHQVRAVIAENAPDDPRFVPELMTMLGDPKSFLRSRAEKSLMALGAIPPPLDPGTTEVAAVGKRIEA